MKEFATQQRDNIIGDDKNSSRGLHNANEDANDNITGGAEAQKQNHDENGEGELEQDVRMTSNEVHRINK